MNQGAQCAQLFDLNVSLILVNQEVKQENKIFLYFTGSTSTWVPGHQIIGENGSCLRNLIPTIAQVEVKQTTKRNHGPKY